FGPLFHCLHVRCSHVATARPRAGGTRSTGTPQEASNTPAAMSNHGVHSSCCASAISKGAVHTATSPTDSEASNRSASNGATPRHQRTRPAWPASDRSNENPPSKAAPAASLEARGTGGTVGDGLCSARAACDRTSPPSASSKRGAGTSPATSVFVSTACLSPRSNTASGAVPVLL